MRPLSNALQETQQSKTNVVPIPNMGRQVCRKLKGWLTHLRERVVNGFFHYRKNHAMVRLGLCDGCDVKGVPVPNPSSIGAQLHEIGAIEKDRVVQFAKRTRDREVPVLYDPESGVIFIDDFYVGDDEYYRGEYSLETQTPTLEDLTDTRRRVTQFKHLCVGRSILDFGCGKGSFLRAVKTCASQVQGVELQHSLREELNLHEIPCFADLSECETPDTLFMFHVLEHLPEPVKTLSQIQERLSKVNGRVVVEVPHARDFLIARARNRSFIDFTLWSQHLVLHTRQSLQLLLQASGFQDIEIFGIQRYGLSNHFGWLIDGLPGGHHGRLSILETPALFQSYESALIRLDATDTLIAVAR